MRGAVAPIRTTYPLLLRPQIVPRRPSPKPGNGSLWVSALVALVMIGGALYLQRRSAPHTIHPTLRGQVALREAPVNLGRVERTVRLTGVTVAGEFVSLITPELPGSRTGPNQSLVATSSSSVSNNAVSASTTAMANASGSGASVPSSTPGSAGRRNSTSRFGTTLRGSLQAPAPLPSVAPAPSSAMGSSGLGSSMDESPQSSTPNGEANPDFSLVLTRLLPAGSQVHKGDVVAEFDRQHILERLNDYRAIVSQAEAALIKQKADLEVTTKAHEQLIRSAKGDLDKARIDMRKIEAVSAMDAERMRLAFQQAQTRYDELVKEKRFVEISDQAQIRTAELGLAQARLELTRAQSNADRMILRAPIDGLTVMQNLYIENEFRQVRQGDDLSTGMFFMQIVNPMSMLIQANVNQVDAERIRIGAKARVRFDAYPTVEFPAHVERMGAIASGKGARIREIPLQLRLEKRDPLVVPDLSVSADLIVESEPKPTTVAPAGAIFSEGTMGKSFVYLKTALGWERREVRAGVSSNVAVAIRSGLRAGDVVALDAPFTPGQIAPGQTQGSP